MNLGILKNLRFQRLFLSDSQINTIMLHKVCNLNLMKWSDSTEEKTKRETNQLDLHWTITRSNPRSSMDA